MRVCVLNVARFISESTCIYIYIYIYIYMYIYIPVYIFDFACWLEGCLFCFSFNSFFF